MSTLIITMVRLCCDHYCTFVQSVLLMVMRLCFEIFPQKAIFSSQQPGIRKWRISLGS